MAFQQKLTMKQGQGLVMTPQLSQSIKLLTMSNIELASFVESELERNPFLERQTNKDDDQRGAGDPAGDEPKHEAATVAELTSHVDLETSAKSLSENIGTSLENVYPDEQDYRKSVAEKAGIKDNEHEASRVTQGGLQVSSASSSHDQQIADYTASQETLRDHLIGQLAIAGVPVELSLVVTDLIDNLDDSGYLRSKLEDVADKLGCDLEFSSKALGILQEFDPIGVGARDLAECLRLQLRDKDHLDPAMALVIDNLDLLAKRDFEQLKKITGLEMEDLHDVLLEIQALDPKPGTAFETSPVQHVVPDIFVREAPDGSWHIELNSETLPRVLVNHSYMTNVSNKLTDDEGKEFVSECLQTANWLTKSLDQRAQTIMKVAREIIKQQDAFLVYGVQHLRPLTLKTVADEIDMHESSVSRVTSNKYMMTPRGLFELKYFFRTAIAATEDGEEHSSEAVRSQIRRLIEAETAKTVLSDDAIVKALRTSGVEIARRTIAKYRDAMHIPSSVQRRREKKALEQAINVRKDEQSTEIRR